MAAPSSGKKRARSPAGSAAHGSDRASIKHEKKKQKTCYVCGRSADSLDPTDQTSYLAWGHKHWVARPMDSEDAFVSLAGRVDWYCGKVQDVVPEYKKLTVKELAAAYKDNGHEKFESYRESVIGKKKTGLLRIRNVKQEMHVGDKSYTKLFRRGKTMSEAKFLAKFKA